MVSLLCAGLLDELHQKSERKIQSPRKPCFSNILPFISTLISRGLYLFSLLLRCIDSQARWFLTSLTVCRVEVRKSRFVFFCVPACVCTNSRPVCCTQSNKLSSQINLLVQRFFFFKAVCATGLPLQCLPICYSGCLQLYPVGYLQFCSAIPTWTIRSCGPIPKVSWACVYQRSHIRLNHSRLSHVAIVIRAQQDARRQRPTATQLLCKKGQAESQRLAF